MSGEKHQTNKCRCFHKGTSGNSTATAQKSGDTHSLLTLAQPSGSISSTSDVSDGGQLTCGRYTCVGGSVAQLALAAASAALASAGNDTGSERGRGTLIKHGLTLNPLDM